MCSGEMEDMPLHAIAIFTFHQSRLYLFCEPIYLEVNASEKKYPTYSRPEPNLQTLNPKFIPRCLVKTVRRL
jgi:hypothetical protein